MGRTPKLFQESQDKPLKQVTIYTDGACDPNPGVGGWGAILMYGKIRKELSGAELETTNNRMELTAVIQALRALRAPCQVTVWTDSQYVKNAFTENWIRGWIRKGWKNVKNVDLWQQLLEQEKRHRVAWQWVRGHADNPHNNRCDELAVAARLQLARGR